MLDLLTCLDKWVMWVKGNEQTFVEACVRLTFLVSLKLLNTTNFPMCSEDQNRKLGLPSVTCGLNLTTMLNAERTDVDGSPVLCNN